VKIHRYCGVETLSTTFPGDVGTHVAKCLWYYKYHNSETPPQDRKGAWLGRLYTQANSLLEQQKGSEKESSNRQALTEILQQLHAGHGEFFDLWQETRAWSIELMQEIYDWAQVSFDSWYWESDVDASSVALIKEYQAKGLFVEDAGAVGINLEQDKLGFCLLLKSDGTGLYATKDIELARRKFQDYQIERSLYVVDNRQSLHFKQVFKTLEYMGFDQAKNCHHLQYEMVELSDGAMSSRKGNIVALQDLIDQMVNTIKQDYLNKYQSDWSEEQIESTANIIAAGAIKYGMNRTDANKKIVFDMQEWLKLDGESGPYIQYVYARITSMLKKHTQPADWNFASLEHARESAIINHLSFYNQTVQTCLEKGVTHTLCQYVYQLAKLYNSFYAECPVANASSESLKSARLGLSTAVANIIEHALGLLGISVPERM
jgi:arginyl-tRNA synthetase